MRHWFKRSSKVTAETARRITGISGPFGGISWADPGPSDAEKVREFILFLEDRRVLFNAYDLEVVSQVERSIHDIRAECTKALQMIAPNGFAAVSIRAMRSAARRFQNDQHEEFRFFAGRDSRREGSPGFFVALGAFRL